MYGGELKGERINGFLGNKFGGNNFGFLLQLAAFAAVACSFGFIPLSVGSWLHGAWPYDGSIQSPSLFDQKFTGKCFAMPALP